MSSAARVVPITVWVSVEDVLRALGCKRSLAYWHLRQAARRQQGDRGLLRVSVAVWEGYAARTFGNPGVDEPVEAPRASIPALAPAGLRLAAANGKRCNDVGLRVTQPRTRPQ